MIDNTLIKCLECNKKFKFLNNTHLKKHNLTVKEYMDKWNVKSVVQEQLKYDRCHHTRGKTYEEIHGKQKGKQLREIRKIHSVTQMQDFNQIKIRKQKCGLWVLDEEQYQNRVNNMKIAISTPEAKLRRKEARIKTYQKTETLNHKPRFSKMAFDYIKKFLKLNNIDESLCYFAQGGINGKEYFYFDKEKQKLVMFDLVVKNINTGKIELVLEYNGPFHWSLNEALQEPNKPATWFKGCTTTRLESYNHDVYKLNIAKRISDSVIVFWHKNKTVETIKPSNKKYLMP